MKDVNKYTRKVSISVIIPVRGRPRLLAEALHSVLNQIYSPFEIIVVVDSTGPEIEPDRDAAMECYSRFQTQSDHPLPPLRILESGGMGPAAARNWGVESSSGEWVAFLDSDDLWAPDKLLRQCEYLEKRPHLHGCQTGEKWIKNGLPLIQPRKLQSRPGSFLLESFTYCLISPSSVMLRKSIFEELGGFDESFPVAEDFEFWLRYLLYYPMGLIPEELTIKRAGDWKQISAPGNHLDYHRSRALIKFLHYIDDRPQLERFEELREAARDELQRKMRIVQTGEEKRPENAGDSMSEHLKRLLGELTNR